MFKLESQLQSALDGFRKKAIKEIKPKTYYVKINEAKNQSVTISKRNVHGALTTICPTNTKTFYENFLDHFDELQKFIPFCSSPTSFRTAWRLRGEKLNIHTADRLVNEGAQLVPDNEISEKVFPQTDSRGVAVGEKRRLVFAVRHSRGNYDDDLSDLGVFTYQPPTDLQGMIRYRWCEYLSVKLNFPFMLIAVMWLLYEKPDGKNTSVFIIAPAKIIKPKQNLRNLSNTLPNPLKLQIVSRSEAYSSLSLLYSMSEYSLNEKIRKPIPKSLEEQYFYKEINSSQKGKVIKKWFRENGKKCPGCKKPFAEFRFNDITFGHIVSRDWASVYPHHQSSVDHPDNLYLTCRSCNSSLGSRFPNEAYTSQDAIMKLGTVGDWIRKIKIPQ
ncbi:MAG: HNH endonuclease [Thaumarchaeota archaeon]|nr:HNH endonuclease [Nitrososphaerota archaeon]